MKFTDFEAEIWKQECNSILVENNLNDMYEHIRRCARVCYQANGCEINRYNAFEWLKNNIISDLKPLIAQHTSVLAHGAVYLTFPYKEERKLYNFYSKLSAQYCDTKVVKGVCYVSTNYRVIYENKKLEDLKYFTTPTEYHEPIITVSMISNIGVNREFNRHTYNWPSEESTRYCNYNKEKYDKQINVALPVWFQGDEIEIQALRDSETQLFMYTDMLKDNEIRRTMTAIDYYLLSLCCADYCYNNLIRLGWKPQQAREVLPLGTKSQLVHTTFLKHWKRFLDIRFRGVSGAPHPNAKYLSEKIIKAFNDYGYKV